MLSSLPPGSLLVLGALAVPLLKGHLRSLWMLALPLLSYAHMDALQPEHLGSFALFDMVLTPVRVDPLSMVWGIVFHIAALLSVIYALHVKDWVQLTAGLMYSGAAIGAAFAGDLITLFVYWELTAITSVFLIWARQTERAYRVGLRYLLIQVGSGVILLAGVILYYSGQPQAERSLAFVQMAGNNGISLAEAGLGVQLIFLAFGIKAAFPLLHNWLQDAYPEATVVGTVFLSAFTTKLAIYTLARGFPGTEILIPIGAVMTLFPIFFAVIENDLRRVLAYSLNNQLGFMVVGIGIGTQLALNGTAAHAFAHIIYKGLLFMAMGAVLYRAGTIKASELGGLYKSMPWTTAFCIVGSLSIAGFPLFSGFISKSMVLAAGAEAHMIVLSIALLIASAGVVDHSGIKIPFFAFFAHDSGRRVEKAPLNMRIAMGLAAALCLFLGFGPGMEMLYSILPYQEAIASYDPWTASHVLFYLQLLLFAALAFGILYLTGLYPPELRAINLDTDVIYRKLLPAVISPMGRIIGTVNAAARTQALRIVRWLVNESKSQSSPTTGLLGEPWPIGTATLWAGILLIISLVMAFT
ncbi:MAG: Na(+)/H(+) antiporter subunit D [Rickettsiales bacterium]|nr:Na(+)/H(+) antiporter subunit D [Rickettsiales bacterium]